MILEEYCSYILSRERDIESFTIPGSKVEINKNELLDNMRTVLRDSGDRDYDSLLVNTLQCFVSKENFEKKNRKFDKNMNAVIRNISKRVEGISILHSMERPIPFSYERVFELLVYYLRITTNILKSGKDQVHYLTADITPEAVIYILNRKLSPDHLDEEWERKGWKAFVKDVKPLSLGMVENYLKFILLATYIRYCEIKNQ